MITYEEACEIVFSAKKFGICLGLERMEAVLKELGNPERTIISIHLAGTNGKGSTLTYLKSILLEPGYSVGTYTSPAITKINDKIQVNGEEISDEDFAMIIDGLIPVIEKLKKTPLGEPTEFELLTAVAFQYFATIAKPDIVLIETGLGGRLDSTNVITPVLSIITNIGHDHMDLLGETIRDVAGEKAGIIKQHVPVISGCKQNEAIEVMKQHSVAKNAELFQLGEHFFCEHKGKVFSFINNDTQLNDLKAGMLGKHQQENATLAIMALLYLNQNDAFNINNNDIRNGLIKAKIANRIEIIQHNPTVIFDGGHNKEGMEALSATLSSNFSKNRIVILFCAMKDKDLKAMLQPITEVASEVVLTSFPYERAMDPQEAFQLFPHKKVKVLHDPVEAFKQINNKLNNDDVFVITGSLYFLNYIRTSGVF